METSLSVVPSGHPDWNESVLAVGKTGYGRVGVDTKIGTREREREREKEGEREQKNKGSKKRKKKKYKGNCAFFLHNFVESECYFYISQVFPYFL